MAWGKKLLLSVFLFWPFENEAAFQRATIETLYGLADDSCIWPLQATPSVDVLKSRECSIGDFLCTTDNSMQGLLILRVAISVPGCDISRNNILYGCWVECFLQLSGYSEFVQLSKMVQTLSCHFQQVGDVWCPWKVRTHDYSQIFKVTHCLHQGTMDV